MRPLVPLVVLVLTFSLAADLRISQPDVVPSEPANYDAGEPYVAAGDGFLVAWSERYSHGIYPGPIRLRTYDADGTPRQEVAFTLATGHNPHAYWNGSEYILIHALPFSRFGSSAPMKAIVAARVRPDGTLHGAAQVPVAMARLGAGVFDVAWNGTEALAAVVYDSTYHLLRLDRDGNLIEDLAVDYQPSAVTVRADGTFFVLRGTQGDSVAARGDRLAVVDDTTAGADVLILDAAGNELERFALSTERPTRSSIVRDGNAWVAAYTRPDTVCTARFTSAADVTRTCTTSVLAIDPALAVGSQRLFKAWDSNGLRTDSGLASTRYTTSFFADAVVDETGLLAAWIETLAAGYRVRVGGIANDGTPRPEFGFDSNTYQDWPTLTRAGDRTLLTWIEGGFSIRAVILGPNGAPLSEVKQLTDRGYNAVVAARGDEWLMVWKSTGGIESALVTRSLDTINIQQFGGTAFQDLTAVTATKAGFLVVWTESEAGVARLVAEPLDATGRRITGGNRIVEGPGPIAYPAVACNGEVCLVTWFGEQDGLWSTLVSHEGVRLSEDRVFASHGFMRDIQIEVLADGAFRVYRGGARTDIDKTGQPGPTVVWNVTPPNVPDTQFGAIVQWRGRPTAVYSHYGHVYAHEFVPRSRAVRH